MKKRKAIMFLTMGMVLASVASAAFAEDAAMSGGVLKIGSQTGVSNIGYPGVGSGSVELFTSMPAIETLCRYTEDGELDPWLCDSFKMDSDALTLTVKLKEGIKFHDGTDFNAEAVKWNWEEFQNVGRNEIAAIETIECPDDYTVVAHLSQWDNTIADNALFIAGFMYSPTFCQENGQDIAVAHPVGTGPFKFVEWEKDVKLVYEKNEDYWIEGQPYLDGIEVDFIENTNTLATAYQAGEIDTVPGALADFASIINATGETTKGNDHLIGSSGLQFAAYGCTDESAPTSNLLVRQAFAHAVNWEELCSTQELLYYTNQWAIPGIWSYNEDVVGYYYDVERAKELLAEAGYPDGVEITCYLNEGATIMGTIIQQYVKDAGITLNLKVIDQARTDEMTGINGNWDGVLLSTGRVDAEIASIYARSFTDGGVRFVGGFLHPEDLADVISRARQTADLDERTALCKEMAKMVIDDYCMLSPIGVTKSLLYEKDYVVNSGFMQVHFTLWTPEKCWINK